MRIAQALDFLHASNAAQFESLSDLIPPELIMTLLGEEDILPCAVAVCPWSAWPGLSLAWPPDGSAGQ